MQAGISGVISRSGTIRLPELRTRRISLMAARLPSRSGIRWVQTRQRALAAGQLVAIAQYATDGRRAAPAGPPVELPDRP